MSLKGDIPGNSKSNITMTKREKVFPPLRVEFFFLVWYHFTAEPTMDRLEVSELAGLKGEIFRGGSLYTSGKLDNYNLIITELKNERFFAFVKFYLSKRYKGLISGQITSFASVEEFVEKMLEHLLANGTHPTRQNFFSGPMKQHFQRIYRRVKSRNFDYDEKIFLPYIQNLPPNASILDFGAGNNNFLPAMADRSGKVDIEYYATDYFLNKRKSLNKGAVKFIHQPSPNELPKSKTFDLIVLRRTAHHIPNFKKIIIEIKNHLKSGGLLVLIEDTYDDQDPSICPNMKSLVDEELTETFYLDLPPEKRLKFLQFNDFYSNHLYHNWVTMPLPMNHKTFSGWENELKNSGMVLQAKHNMGFPRNIYNLHQAATGILCWEKVSR